VAKRGRRIVLFLGAGGLHGRIAEALFNSVAARMGLPWVAASRAVGPARTGLAGDPAAVVRALRALGVRDADLGPSPPVTDEDAAGATHVIGVNLQPDIETVGGQAVEHWEIEAGGDAVPVVEQRVMGLIARLLGGGDRPVPDTPVADLPPARPNEVAKKPVTLKVGRETAGRRGKGVTTVFDTPLDEDGLKELAATLKQRCGTGGTVKGGRIEIQGDQRERVAAELERMGYKVKRAGG
jgi:translation initiation factor 1